MHGYGVAPFVNHYTQLGVSSAATIEEIRRAYRILARRYHPDVNPGAASEEKFKKIAEAYRVVSDPERRRSYDVEFEFHIQREKASTRRRAYEQYDFARERHARATGARPARPERDQPRRDSRAEEPTPEESTFRKVFSKVGVQPIATAARRVRDALRAHVSPHEPTNGVNKVTQVSIIEVSLSIFDAIRGVRKSIEISEGTRVRKISIHVPPGVRNGSVIRFRHKGAASEEVVIIARIAAHQCLSITPKGLVVEVPITINEAMHGARIQVPGIDEPVIITVEPGSQSGTELRIKDRGIPQRDGSRGDLFVRLMIQIPSAANAVGLKERVEALEAYYGTSLRKNLPKSVFDL
jgi:curved DNA-binding protein